jgi:hypothetical protein
MARGCPDASGILATLSGGRVREPVWWELSDFPGLVMIPMIVHDFKIQNQNK